MDGRVKAYIGGVVFATREPTRKGMKDLATLIEYGGSPRASIALALAARAHAFLRHRGYVTPEAVKALGPDLLPPPITPPSEPPAPARTRDQIVAGRMNGPFVKVFVEERERTVVLVGDMSQREQWGPRRASKARVAAEIGALCAFSAIKNNDRVGLILGTEVVEKLVPPQKGEKHVLRVIREILGYEPKYTGTNLKLLLETLSKVAKRRSVAFVVSDFFAEGYERALALAAAKHDVIPVMLVDPRDEELPDVGLATFEAWETGEAVVVATGDKRVAAHD